MPKISDLTSKDTLNGAEELPVIESGSNYRVTTNSVAELAGYNYVVDTEQPTMDRFLGKPVYMITVDLGSTITDNWTTTKSPVHGSNDYVKYVLRIEGFIGISSSGYFYAIPRVQKDGTNQIEVWYTASTDALSLRSSGGWGTSNYDIAYITVFYTKSADYS